MSNITKQREKETLKDIQKVIKLLDKIKDSETFVGVVIDEKFYNTFATTLNDASETFKDEINED